VRLSLTDVREKRYEKSGMYSSYFFRLDREWALDATMKVPAHPYDFTGNNSANKTCKVCSHVPNSSQGGKARFINHSCEPNCYTRVIGLRAYVYASRIIVKDEELSYDYKVPKFWVLCYRLIKRLVDAEVCVTMLPRSGPRVKGLTLAFCSQFPLEPDEAAITCLCGAPTCRGRLN
jgi:hypothetical protein